MRVPQLPRPPEPGSLQSENSWVNTRGIKIHASKSRPETVHDFTTVEIASSKC